MIALRNFISADTWKFTRINGRLLTVATRATCRYSCFYIDWMVGSCEHQKLPTTEMFHSAVAGHWLKFSTSNNRTSGDLHWLRYCRCAKLINLQFYSPYPPLINWCLWKVTLFPIEIHLRQALFTRHTLNLDHSKEFFNSSIAHLTENFICNY